MKSLDGGVMETTSRFQIACPALNHPAFRPTRGSGVGAVADMSAEGAGAPPPPPGAPPEAQPAAASTLRTSIAVDRGLMGAGALGGRNRDADGMEDVDGVKG